MVAPTLIRLLTLLPIILTTSISLATAQDDSLKAAPASPPCRCAPTDSCWPSSSTWNNLNSSVDGRLIKTVPIGSPCHDPTYDAAACQKLRTDWVEPTLHDASSHSMMTPFFAKASCDPFTRRDKPCRLGTYPRYVINVTETDHVIKGIKFAKRHNLRLVVRNTGHDFMGKSTGYGSLSLWTHHLKDIRFISNYIDANGKRYGTAVKVGAGVQTGDLYLAAQQRGLLVVGGECASVGFAGGYIQGGGHSALSSYLGLAADHALSFEVITADGRIVQANKDHNPSLFWALRGGGGGTYGVVWSVTVKTHPDVPVSGAVLTFSEANPVKFHAALAAYHKFTPAWTDKGVFAYAFYASGYFQIWPLFAPTLTSAQVKAMIAPFTNVLTTLGIAYTATVSSYPTFLDAYNALFVPITVGGFQFGGRFIPRSVITDDADIYNLFINIVRDIVDDGASVIDVAMRPTLSVAGYPDNAVNPAWRSAERLFLPALPWNNTAPWESMVADRSTITNVYNAALKSITPGGGAYLNEADADEPDWKRAFYGSQKYGQLLKIKDTWDPEGVFYGRTSVGGDRWAEDATGRLCKV